MSRHNQRSASFSSDEESITGSGKPLPAPILVYHESARSIVFRDQLRRAADQQEKEVAASADLKEFERVASLSSELSQSPQLDHEHSVTPVHAGVSPNQIAGFTPKIEPLPIKEFGPDDVFTPLLSSTNPKLWSPQEQEVVELLASQHATVKTIKNDDWTAFLKRFCFAQPPRARVLDAHNDIPPDPAHPFNSFVTSTTMLPPNGLKMRCYGSPSQYTVGIVFGLPTRFPDGTTEDECIDRTETWSWPAGYSAKTEFNIDGRGMLINGRREALRSIPVLRQYNEDYLTKEEYMVSNRLVSGLNQIPYNEVFLRVGGHGRLVLGKDVATNAEATDGTSTGRSFERGVGLPIALFVRTATYGHLVTLMRTRSRLQHILGDAHIKGIPLLMITPEEGVRVLTDRLQKQLWKIASSTLNPFQNPNIAYKTTMGHTVEESFQQKVEELLEFDETIQDTLTPEELARIAGGFGATDESVAKVLKKVMTQDSQHGSQNGDESHRLQDVVNEGLAYAVRAGDYHTSRQLLILYSLVASHREEIVEISDEDSEGKSLNGRRSPSLMRSKTDVFDSVNGKPHALTTRTNSETALSTNHIPPPPPPPPLDTDRLRGATNSDGLLAVLGAAQVLKAMQDGSAKKRAFEVVSALEEWVNYGEQSMAFRISSWYDQRAAQGDLQIATENNSNFMAFVSNKAITNRKNFAQQLRDAIESTNFSDLNFLTGIAEILNRMHSPCLRLELLQYVLGLDNRFSIAHVRRSVELSATCLGMTLTTEPKNEDGQK